jgi:hypothetical protein
MLNKSSWGRRAFRCGLSSTALAVGLVASAAMAEPTPVGAVIQRDYKGAYAEHREIARHAICS